MLMFLCFRASGSTEANTGSTLPEAQKLIQKLIQKAEAQKLIQEAQKLMEAQKLACFCATQKLACFLTVRTEIQKCGHRAQNVLTELLGHRNFCAAQKPKKFKHRSSSLGTEAQEVLAWAGTEAQEVLACPQKPKKF